MNMAKWVLSGTFVLALQGTVSAQIYESTDAEGVPEFSDTSSAGSEVVDLQRTNVADKPPEIPEAPQAAPVRAAPVAANAPAVEVGEPVYDVYGGNYDDDDDARVRRHLNKDRIENSLPGHEGPGVDAPVERQAPVSGTNAAVHPGGRR
tara:strand:+ start:303602 stop:304048 length:447 start_codon:yes stop_codon:yes gene_type:complete